MDKQKARESCTYRVLSPLIIRATGQYIPAGVVADLSDVSDKMLRWLLERNMIETADATKSEPLFNDAVGAVERKPCPCGK